MRIFLHLLWCACDNKVKIPAEEGGHGKIILLEKGAYKEMHACLMYGSVPPSHIGIS